VSTQWPCPRPAPYGLDPARMGPPDRRRRGRADLTLGAGQLSPTARNNPSSCRGPECRRSGSPRSGGPDDLRRLRTSAGLSSRTLAARAHMSVLTYIRWESGHTKRLPARQALKPSAKALNVTVDEVESAIVTARANASQAATTDRFKTCCIPIRIRSNVSQGLRGCSGLLTSDDPPGGPVDCGGARERWWHVRSVLPSHWGRVQILSGSS
jgi:transcriptional regulator with XRE-family HTH domain